MSITVGIIIIAVLSYIISLWGFKMIHTFEKYSWFGAFILLLVLVGQAAPHVDPSIPGDYGNSGVAFSANFLTILAINFCKLSLVTHFFTPMILISFL
jgi:purine-cytosine permease-like protein